MLKQLSMIDLIKAIQERVNAGTGLKCVDHVEVNEPSPFYYAVFNGANPVNSKTMFVLDYRVNIHCIAEPSDSSVPIYNLIQNLEEAMTEDITLPEGYTLIMQVNNGVLPISTDETNEKHAVIPFTFRISYGFKAKI
jgi:hypothetical protein